MEITIPELEENLSSFLANCRLEGDEALDNIFEKLMAGNGPEALKDMMEWAGDTREFELNNIPENLRPLFQDYSFLPDFANREQMDAGFRFFKKYVAPIAMLLGCYSLPYCYMGADGAQVLYFSEKIHQNTTKRLNDTGDFVREMHNQSNWKSEENFVRAFKVRVMHALIRSYLKYSPKWDMSWGLPLNQEDKAGTNLAFSYIVLEGLKKLGFKYSEKEAEAYLHTWKVIGYFMGVKNELLVDTMKQAKMLDGRIVERNFRESETGKYLAKALIDSSRSVIKIPFLKDIPTAIMREMLGEDYSEKLCIPDMPIQRKLIKYIPFNLLVRNSKVIKA